MSQTTHHFTVGGWPVEIAFADEGRGGSMALLPSFRPFEAEAAAEPLLRLTVDPALGSAPREELTLIRTFDTGNGLTTVFRQRGGGYQYRVCDPGGTPCCLLRTSADFARCQCALAGNAEQRSFGLNNALMLAYAFAAAPRHTLLIHASLVRHGGRGYAFIARSGTGKSTHVALWMRHIEGCDLMNDDCPVVRVENDGTPYIYGTPWSGKTPCYRQTRAPLAAVTRIARAAANSIERLAVADAVASLLPACSTMKWDAPVYAGVRHTLAEIIRTIPLYTLHCLPDREAALLCHDTLTRTAK